MKIGIVGWGLMPGKTGGTETYFRNLIRSLQHIDKKNHYIIFLRRECAHELVLDNPHFKVVLLEEESFADKVLRKLQLPFLQSRQSQRINAAHLDVVHFPFQTIFPEGVRTKTVLSFMDMQHEFHPEFFTPSELRGRKATYAPSAEAADAIIAISDFTKASIVGRYGINAQKITTVHLSYDEELFQPNRQYPPTDTLPSRYFYYPAATWPHKNHQRLLKAFAKVVENHPEFSLVLSGINTGAVGTISKAAAELGIANHVHILGYLPYASLPAVYGKCFALVYPSLFEGFGIPLLEAMAMRRPIICSNTTCLPEIAGDAALFINPQDIEDISAKMLLLIKSEKEQELLVSRGSKRLQQFSWNTMAQQTLEVYRSAFND